MLHYTIYNLYYILYTLYSKLHTLYSIYYTMLYPQNSMLKQGPKTLSRPEKVHAGGLWRRRAQLGCRGSRVLGFRGLGV